MTEDKVQWLMNIGSLGKTWKEEEKERQVLGRGLVGQTTYLHWFRACVCARTHVCTCGCARTLVGGGTLLGGCEEWSSLTQRNYLPASSLSSPGPPTSTSDYRVLSEPSLLCQCPGCPPT